MDVLQRVHDIGAGASVSEAAILSARRELASAVRAERSTPRRMLLRHPAVAVSAVVAGVAATATAVLVVPHLIPPTEPVIAIPTTPASPTPGGTTTPRPEPSSQPESPRTVLASVAHQVKAGKAPTPAVGQYVRIETVSQQLISYNAQDGVNDLAVWRTNADAAWVATPGGRTTYVPADIHGEWLYRDNGGAWAIGETFGGDAAAIAQQWAAEHPPTEATEWRIAGGSQANWPDGSGDSTADFFAKIPADPEQIIEWLTAELDGQSQKVGWNLARLLSYNVGTVETRSAMYDALSRLPGSEITHVDAQTVTLVFHAAASVEGDVDTWYSITIDRASGTVTEYTERIGSNPALVPDAVPDLRVTSTVTVIDAIP